MASRQFGLLAPVVYLAGPSGFRLGIPPVGSYPTLSPITCAGGTPLAGRVRPSAGLLSVALDVAEGLRPSVPRLFGPSGLCYESGLCSTFRAEALKRSDGSDGPDRVDYTLATSIQPSAPS